MIFLIKLKLRILIFGILTATLFSIVALFAEFFRWMRFGKNRYFRSLPI